MKKYRYGIISAASIVPRFVGALEDSKRAKVWCIGASSKKRAKAMAEKADIPHYYGSYEEVYQDPKVDVVYIATINEQHFDQIMMALSYKKHVICEKPFVLTKEDAEKAFAYAKEQNCFLMEAQKSVFLPTTQFVKDKIIDKTFGKLQQIQISSSYAGRHPKGHWMYDSHQGGALFGSASYIIEYLLHLLDMPEFEVQSMTHLGKHKEIDDVMMQFKFNNDLLASTHLSTRVDTQNQASFHFENAMITINDFWKARKLKVTYWDNGKSDTMKFPVDYEMVYEVNHVGECLDDGLITSPIMTPELTIKCVELVNQIYQQSLKD